MQFSDTVMGKQLPSCLKLVNQKLKQRKNRHKRLNTSCSSNMGWYFSRDSFFNILDSSSEKDKNKHIAWSEVRTSCTLLILYWLNSFQKSLNIILLRSFEDLQNWSHIMAENGGTQNNDFPLMLSSTWDYLHQLWFHCWSHHYSWNEDGKRLRTESLPVQ